MPLTFEFATAGRILFGDGIVSRLPALAREFGSRAMVVHGASRERAQPLLSALTEAGVTCCSFGIRGEPTTHIAGEGAEAARAARCEMVLGLGGGSVLDGAKAIAALATNPGTALDYMEVIGKGLPIACDPLPLIAIPTTAGTGSEVTRNTVLLSPEHRVKASIRHARLLPRLALVDPQLMYSAPPAVTAAAGMDALTQLIEPYLSTRANPVTDGLALEGIARVARSLKRAFRDGQDRQAREDMAVASLFGGLCLANAGLGVVHGISGPLGGMFPAPHGAICAQLLPRAMRINLRAMRAREPGSIALERVTQVARVLTGQASAAAEQACEWLDVMCRTLGIPPLAQYGVAAGDVSALTEKSMAATSTKTNPILLTPAEVGEIISASL
jgi:alcohol dehydrogenase class IV